MIDCPEGEIRDLLPLLLAERLLPAERSAVEAHLAGCTACAAELSLLAEMRRALDASPPVDVGAIVRALPSPRPRVPGRVRGGWRTAAAITLLLAGGASLAVVEQHRRSGAAPAGMVRASHPSPSAGSVVATVPVPRSVRFGVDSVLAGSAVDRREPAARTGGDAAPSRELAVGAGTMSALDERDLARLVRDIDEFDLVPSTDVEHVDVAPVSPARGRT